jgi:hypothetical protein
MTEIMEATRKRFRPNRITTLFVGESRPHSGAFFYDQNSNLFKAMKKAFDAGDDFLELFQTSGFYLDDLVEEPVNKIEKRARKARCRENIPSLAARIKKYNPEAIVILMCGIRPMVVEAMFKAGLTYEPYCTPFPTFGNQRRFHEAMIKIIPSLPFSIDNKLKEQCN